GSSTAPPVRLSFGLGSVPFPTRMVVVRLSDGGLWVWSPTQLVPTLRRAIEALGLVRHLVWPNRMHYGHVAEWKRAFPGASAWASPGVREPYSRPRGPHREFRDGQARWPPTARPLSTTEPHFFVATRRRAPASPRSSRGPRSAWSWRTADGTRSTGPRSCAVRSGGCDPRGITLDGKRTL